MIVYVVLTQSMQIAKPSVVEDLTVIMTVPYQLTNCKVLSYFSLSTDFIEWNDVSFTERVKRTAKIRRQHQNWFTEINTTDFHIES